MQAKGLPSAVKKCRVVWARSAKVQMTEVKDVKASGESWMLCGVFCATNGHHRHVSVPLLVAEADCMC